MLAKRIIPCLDIKDGQTVKGTNFVNLRQAGDPVELGRTYSEQGADELVFLDITASHEGANLYRFGKTGSGQYQYPLYCRRRYKRTERRRPAIECRS